MASTALHYKLRHKKANLTAPSKKAKKNQGLGGVLRKFSVGLNLVALKIRSLSDEIFEPDQTQELFAEQSSEEAFELFVKPHKGHTTSEEKFLKEFQKYKSLDGMYEAAHDGQSQSQASKSDQTRTLNEKSLDEIMRQINTNDYDDMDQDDEDMISFTDLDVCELRKAHEEQNITESSSTLQPSQVNIGERLWRLRRKLWVTPKKTEEEINKRYLELPLKNLPSESYIKVYRNLIEKGKPLKDEKKINLGELIKVINCGWVAEQKWERAAKGLA